MSEISLPRSEPPIQPDSQASMRTSEQMSRFASDRNDGSRDEDDPTIMDEHEHCTRMA
jgi:hypothetical protein